MSSLINKIAKSKTGTVIACLFAAGVAIYGEVSSRQDEKEMEDLKERVKKLEKKEN